MLFSSTYRLLSGAGKNANNGAARAADQNAQLAGGMAGIAGAPAHVAAVGETMHFTIGCIPDYRRRINQMIAFWKESYPGYYAQVVTPLKLPNKELKKVVSHCQGGFEIRTHQSTLHPILHEWQNESPSRWQALCF